MSEACGDSDNLSAFFTHHPILENISIKFPLSPGSFPVNTLPRLHSLSFVAWHNFSMVIPDDLASRREANGRLDASDYCLIMSKASIDTLLAQMSGKDAKPPHVLEF
ncbi:hypothetical protein M422DRAFT_251918 [Sphaerobolus stellatus SS14]|uniref:Uncharacterized protein n=1 Tax=Sphaerobolus stellatus (strain SS14) TaxID=990650 RepID=A0A0C9VQL9_SPHS4|nr:hypothetical protein M422DRAFT_251918 [Sphaerobolus stellatus SS14]